MAIDTAATTENRSPRIPLYYYTPDKLIAGLLVVELLLWCSDRFKWFPFNQHKGWTVLIAVATAVGGMLAMLIWLAAALALRWRFQFSIRSLLVLVLVVAAPCSWLAMEMKKAREQRMAIGAIEGPGGYVTYDCLFDSSPPSAELRGPVLLRKLLGDDFFNDTCFAFLCNNAQVGDNRIKDASLQQLEGLTQLKGLWLDNTYITDEGLENLKGLNQLQELHLQQTQVTDEGVKKLQQALPNCKIEH